MKYIYIFILIFCIHFFFGNHIALAATITISPNTTFQTWRSAGGEGLTKTRPISGPPCVSATMTDATFNSLLDHIVDDLGLNRLRVMIYLSQGLEAAANDNADPFTFSDVTNWTPYSTALTTPYNIGSGCIIGTTSQWMSNVAAFRAKLASSGVPAETAVSFIFYTERSNMPLWWQNDVDEASEAFEAVLRWTNKNYGFYPEYATWNEPTPPPSGSLFTAGGGAASWYGGWAVSLKNRFAAAGIPTKIESPNTASGGATEAALDAIAREPGAEQSIDRIAFHAYALPSLAQQQTLAARAKANGQETGMDEICCKGIAHDYSGGLTLLSGYMMPTILNANISMWAQNGISGRCQTPGAPPSSCGAGGLWGIDFEPDMSRFYLQPFYFVLRQFTHYVRPGYVRVAASVGGGNPVTTAWKRPDGTFVIVMANTGGATPITVNGLPNLPFTVHKLDPTMCTTTGFARCTPDDSTTLTPSGGAVSFTMPASAVWTLSQGTSGSTPPPPADTTPPSVSISSPTGSVSVSGTVNVFANASDNVGVLGVQFKLDGVNLGSEDTAAPYSVSWNTTSVSNGNHALTAVARDAAGNQTTSGGISVLVNNQTAPSCVNPSPVPVGFSAPCPVLSLSASSVSKPSGSLTITATPLSGSTAYIWTTIYISNNGAWVPHALSGSSPYPGYSASQATLTLSGAPLSTLTLGLHYIAQWDWTWNGSCYIGPGASACNQGSWRVQTVTVN